MAWIVTYHDAFDPEFDVLPETVQDALLGAALLLQATGPMLGRPHVDTLSGSKHANMKELRFNADDGVWKPGATSPAWTRRAISTAVCAVRL